MPAEHSTSLDRESAALAAPMGTPCLLLARETAPIDAYAGFADSSKGRCRGIVLLFSAGLDFSLLKLPVIAIIVLMSRRLSSQGIPSAGNSVSFATPKANSANCVF